MVSIPLSAITHCTSEGSENESKGSILIPNGSQSDVA